MKRNRLTVYGQGNMWASVPIRVLHSDRLTISFQNMGVGYRWALVTIRVLQHFSEQGQGNRWTLTLTGCGWALVQPFTAI